jgi:ParB family transcriptional regulator, chromosome partitioning protein
MTVGNATGLRVLSAIVSAVPVRLMKRDLLFIVESLLPLLDEPRLAMIARNRGIRAKEGESVGRLLATVLRKADESELGRAMVETAILLAARSQSDGGKVLKAAAQTYKVDTDAIALKVKQDFAAKQKAKSDKRVEPKPATKALKKTA